MLRRRVPRTALALLMCLFGLALAALGPAAPVGGQSGSGPFDVRGTWELTTKSRNGGSVEFILVIRTQRVRTGNISGQLRVFDIRQSVSGRVQRARMTLDAGVSRYSGTLDRDRRGRLTWTGEVRDSGGNRSSLKGILIKPREIVPDGTPGPTSAAGGTRPSATFVMCDRDMLETTSTRLECSAYVGDASFENVRRIPSGRVRWSTEVGSVAQTQCTLDPRGLGGSAGCVTEVRARSGQIQPGTAPPVTARYLGDETFATSEGSPGLFGAAAGYQSSNLIGGSALVQGVVWCCADPIDPATGELSLAVTDLAVTGRGPALAMSRSYSSLAVTAAPPDPHGRPDLGPGWGHAFEARAITAADSTTATDEAAITIRLGTGATIPFTRSGDGFTSPPWVRATLRTTDEGGLRLTFDSQSILEFDADGRLAIIDGPEREPLTLTYTEQGDLDRVTDAAGRQLSFTHDTAGRITSVIDPTGTTVAYEYDAAGDLVASADRVGVVSRFGYDDAHRLVTISDVRGETTTSYDDQGRVSGQVLPSGARVSFRYLGDFPNHTTIVRDGSGIEHAFAFRAGTLEQRIDALGTPLQRATDYVVDEHLAVIALRDAAGSLWRLERNDGNDIVASTDPLGRRSTFTWDDAHRPTSATTPMGRSTRVAYDDAGLLVAVATAAGTPLEATLAIERADEAHPTDVTAVTDASGARTAIGYDPFGRLTSITDATGATSALTLDPTGFPTSMTDPLGRLTTLTRDDRGALTSATTSLGDAGSPARDDTGRLISWSDPLGVVTAVERDEAGRPVRLLLADGTSQSVERDALRRIVAHVDGLGERTTIELDDLGRVISRTDAAGASWTWAYDVLDRLVEAVGPDGARTGFGWNAAGQLVRIDHAENSADVTFEYDDDGHRVAMTDGTGTTRFTWDAAGRLVETIDGAGRAVRTGWDESGRLTSVEQPDGSVSYAYDALGRMTRLVTDTGEEATFAYDAVGRLISMTQSDGSHTTWTYDPLGRVTAIRSKVPGEGVPILDLAYAWDAAGRMTSITDAGVTRGVAHDDRGRLTAVGDESYTFDAGDRLTGLRDRTLGYAPGGRLLAMADVTGTTSFTHDAAGRRTSHTDAGGVTRTYAWDGSGRLAEANGTRYTYDGDGLRAAVTEPDGTTTRLTWLRGTGRPLLIDDGTHRFIQGPTGPIAQVDGAGVMTWLHADVTGSVRALTDAQGAVEGTADWDAWGSPTGSTAGLTSRFGYHGEYTDPGTGLQALGVRPYDPMTGQFLSIDPDVGSTHHAYAFAASDPLRYGDTTGLDPEQKTVLAGHGVWSSTDGYVTVPEGTTVIFHQPAGSKMTDPYGVSIEKGQPTRYAEVYGPGSRIPNYTLSPPVKPFLHTLPTSVTVGKDTLLSDLIAPGMGTVDWAACRAVDREDRTWSHGTGVWRPVTTYSEDPESPAADWGGLVTTQTWKLVIPSQEIFWGHIPAPVWDAQGPVMNDRYSDIRPNGYDPAWYDWESDTTLPWRPS